LFHTKNFVLAIAANSNWTRIFDFCL